PPPARAAHRRGRQRQPGHPAHPTGRGAVPRQRAGPLGPARGRRHDRRRRHHPRGGPRGHRHRRQRPAAGRQAFQLGWQRRREQPVMTERVVLAYSGGLDTSVAIPYLAEQTGAEVIAVAVDVGQGGEDLEVIAPARDFAWTRDKAIAYAQERDLPIDVTHKSPYSIDQNVWGRAVETGFLEDIWNAPIEDVYSYTADPTLARDPDTVLITFDAGRPVAIDGETVTPYQAVTELNRRAGAQGVGRLDMVEDRLVGIKSREGYEAPGAIALITAHQELENVTVERDVARFK